jgi:hypothetical protein
MNGIEIKRGSVLEHRLASMAADMERGLCNPKLEPILYDIATENGIAAIVSYGGSARFTLVDDAGRLEHADYERVATLEDFVNLLGYGRQLPDDEVLVTVPRPR